MNEGRETLARSRVLVVEDELLIALDIETMPLTSDREVVELSATIPEALALIAATDRLDGAMLDLDLQGEPVLPVIEALEKGADSVMLVTGYGRRETDNPALRDARRLAKPFSPENVADAMRKTFLRTRP